VTVEDGGVKIMAIESGGGICDNGVIGIVEGSKIDSEPKQNFNSAVESVHRWLKFQHLSQLRNDIKT
jgi:hypothetical protein